MSERERQDDDATAASAEQAEGPSAERDDGAESQGEPAGRTVANRGGGRVVAWMALLVAVAALVLATRPFWPPAFRWVESEAASETAERLAAAERRVSQFEQRLDERASTLESRLDELADRAAASSEVADLRESLQSLSSRVTGMRSDSNDRAGSLSARMDELEQRVADRLTRFESRLTNLDGEIEGADRDLATRLSLIEIDSLMRMAEHRLELGDAVGARQAWERVHSQVETLNGTRYSELRDATSRTLEQLDDGAGSIDAGAVRRLLRIAAAVPRWPARGDAPEDDAPATAEPEGWRERVGEVMSGLVRVESVDPERPGAAEVERLRSEIPARLEHAALALVRRDHDVARVMVESAVAGIERAFPDAARPVSEALSELRSLELEPNPVEAPMMDEARALLDELLGETR